MISTTGVWWLGITNGGWVMQPTFAATNEQDEVITCKSLAVAEFWIELSKEVEECRVARMERQAERYQ